MKKLQGKVALVTGAGRGIGREVALCLASEGANIIAHYASSREGAEDVVRLCRDKGMEAIAYQADIANRSEVKQLFEQIDNNPGRLDIVVNCSGVSAGGSLPDLDEDELEWMLGINLRGPLFIASEAAKRLSEGGRIINFGSTMSEFSFPGAGIYGATKAAIKAFTESWARELGAKGITVNTVIPGATSPGMADSTPEEYRAFFENASPMGRIGHAGEIAAVVKFLSSPEASWVSGAHILANGAANT